MHAYIESEIWKVVFSEKKYILYLSENCYAYYYLDLLRRWNYFHFLNAFKL